MANLRSYEDPCGIARALDVVGERWALLLVRELVLGPKRFGELRQGLPGASPNVLAQRLRELEGGGVLRRSAAVLAAAGEPVPPTAGAAYELTEWGHELHPLLARLGAWGARAPGRPPGELSPDALLVALESTFTPARAGDLAATCELQLSGRRFALTIGGGALTIRRGPAGGSGGAGGSGADATVVTEVATLRAVAFGDRSIADAEADGALELRGDARLARRILRCFARPPVRAT